MDSDEKAARETARHFDIRKIDAAFLADPFPTYHLLRRHDPVPDARSHRGGPLAALLRHDLSRALAADHSASRRRSSV